MMTQVKSEMMMTQFAMQSALGEDQAAQAITLLTDIHNEREVGAFL